MRPPMTRTPDALPERALSALAEGRKIEAIKALREAAAAPRSARHRAMPVTSSVFAPSITVR